MIAYVDRWTDWVVSVEGNAVDATFAFSLVLTAANTLGGNHSVGREPVCCEGLRLVRLNLDARQVFDRSLLFGAESARKAGGQPRQ